MPETTGDSGPLATAVTPPAPSGGARRAAGRVPGPLVAVAGMFTVQLGIAWSTTLFGPLGVAGATALRLLVSAGVLLLIARPSLAGRTRRELATVAVLGLASGGMTLLFAASIERIPMGVTSTIEFLGPLGVALASSRKVPHAAWALLAGLGVLLLCLVGAGRPAQGGLNGAGLAFAAAAAVCWAAYVVFTRRVGEVFEGFQGLAMSITVASLAVLPIGGAQAWLGLAHAQQPLSLLGRVVGVALLFPVITYMLEMTALRRLSSRVFGVLASLEPGVAVLIGFLVLGQTLALVQLAGLACVIIASIATMLGDRAADRP